MMNRRTAIKSAIGAVAGAMVPVTSIAYTDTLGLPDVWYGPTIYVKTSEQLEAEAWEQHAKSIKARRLAKLDTRWRAKRA